MTESTPSARKRKNREYQLRYLAKNPDKWREYQRLYREKNRDKLREGQRRYRIKNREKLREKERLYRPRKLDRKRASKGLPPPTRPQPECCECCGIPSGNKALCLDHCHETGAFRGWLCTICNFGIGMLGDNEESVMLAVLYLKRNKPK